MELELGLVGLGLGSNLGLMEHDDQALALPAFTLTALPLTSTSRGGLCRSWASKVCGSSAKYSVHGEDLHISSTLFSSPVCSRRHPKYLAGKYLAILPS